MYRKFRLRLTTNFSITFYPFFFISLTCPALDAPQPFSEKPVALIHNDEQFRLGMLSLLLAEIPNRVYSSRVKAPPFFYSAFFLCSFYQQQLAIVIASSFFRKTIAAAMSYFKNTAGNAESPLCGLSVYARTNQCRMRNEELSFLGRFFIK